MLSSEEKQEYLNQIIRTTFVPLTSTSSRMAVINTNMEIAWLTKALAKFFDKETSTLEKLIDPFQPSFEFIQQFCLRHRVSPEIFIDTFQKTSKIIQKVIDKKHSANFVVLMPLHKSLLGYGRIATPLLHPNGEVVGVQLIGYNYSLFGIQEFVHLIDKAEYRPKMFYPEDIGNPNYNKRKLSQRQGEILFLVAQGISQELSAQILNIKRGTLSKVITDQICPKFDIFPPNYIKLLEMAHKENYDKYIPERFWKTQVFELC